MVKNQHYAWPLGTVFNLKTPVLLGGKAAAGSAIENALAVVCKEGEVV